MTLRRIALAAALIPLLGSSQSQATETIPVLFCQAATPTLHLFVAKRPDGMPVLHVECTRPGDNPEDRYTHFKQSSRVTNTVKRAVP